MDWLYNAHVTTNVFWEEKRFSGKRSSAVLMSMMLLEHAVRLVIWNFASETRILIAKFQTGDIWVIWSWYGCDYNMQSLVPQIHYHTVYHQSDLIQPITFHVPPCTAILVFQANYPQYRARVSAGHLFYMIYITVKWPYHSRLDRSYFSGRQDLVNSVTFIWEV